MNITNNNSFESPPLNIMKYFQLYLIAIVVFYFIGPVQWQTQNKFLLLLFLFFYQAAFAIGYSRQMKRPVRSANNLVCDKNFIIRHFGIFCLVALILNLLILIRISLLYGISSIFQTMVLSLTDATKLYHANAMTEISAEMYGGSFLAVVNALASPITVAIVPIGFVLRKELPRRTRFVFFASVVSYFFMSMSTGRSEGLLKIAISLIIAFLLKKEKTRSNGTEKRPFWKVFVILAVVIGFLFAYSALMENRTLGSLGIPIGSNQINMDNALLKMFPGLSHLIVYLHIYLTEGYFGMSLALGHSWIPTFFCGFSPWFRGEIEGLLGIDIKSATYMARATEYGWKYGTNWHTAYTWFANDVHWIGVIVLMYLAGKLLADVYRDAYNKKNPIAIGLLFLMVIFVIYLPANNYLFSDSDTFITFFVFLLLYRVGFKVKI